VIIRVQAHPTDRFAVGERVYFHPTKSVVIDENGNAPLM
jgi:hypothetical protein